MGNILHMPGIERGSWFLALLFAHWKKERMVMLIMMMMTMSSYLHCQSRNPHQVHLFHPCRYLPGISSFSLSLWHLLQHYRMTFRCYWRILMASNYFSLKVGISLICTVLLKPSSIHFLSHSFLHFKAIHSKCLPPSKAYLPHSWWCQFLNKLIIGYHMVLWLHRQSVFICQFRKNCYSPLAVQG